MRRLNRAQPRLQTISTSPRLTVHVMARDELEGEEAEAGAEGAAGMEERF
jgi:hypothetical protein